MSRRYFDDRTNRQVPPEECTVLKVTGPLAVMTGRRELHLDKPNALALARWLGYELARPDLPEVPGPEAPAADPAALRVEGLTRGTRARSRPPRPGK